MDAEVFGDEPIGSAAAGQHAHEGQVGDGLHGGENEGRAVGWEQVAHERKVTGRWSGGRKRLDMQVEVGSFGATTT